jgi:hypothetical protein
MSSQSLKPRRTSTVLDPYAAPHIYYGESHSKKHVRARTYSAVSAPSLSPAIGMVVLTSA